MDNLTNVNDSPYESWICEIKSLSEFETISKALRAAAYDADAKPNKYQQNFNEKATKMDVADGFQEIHRTLYRVIDDTWR